MDPDAQRRRKLVFRALGMDRSSVPRAQRGVQGGEPAIMGGLDRACASRPPAALPAEGEEAIVSLMAALSLRAIRARGPGAEIEP